LPDVLISGLWHKQSRNIQIAALGLAGKPEILAAAAKYDVSCASSGAAKRDSRKGGTGARVAAPEADRHALRDGSARRSRPRAGGERPARPKAHAGRRRPSDRNRSPSYLLRLTDATEKRREWRRFLDDLAAIREAA